MHGRLAVHQSGANPWLVNFRVRQFSVTVRITVSGASFGSVASISRVTRTCAWGRPARWEITSWVIWLCLKPRAGRV